MLLHLFPSEGRRGINAQDVAEEENCGPPSSDREKSDEKDDGHAGISSSLRDLDELSVRECGLKLPVEELSSLPKLAKLDVRGNRDLDEAFVAAIKEKNPKLQVSLFVFCFFFNYLFVLVG